VWVDGPRPWRRMMRALAKRPGLIRAIGAAEAAVGVWVALKDDN